MKKILASLVSLFICVCCVANKESTTPTCSSNSSLDLQKINLKPIQLNNQPLIKSDIVSSDNSIGYTFPAKAGQKINYHTTSNVCIKIFDSKYQQINHNFLPQNGIYTLQVYTPHETTNFDIEISLDISPISPFQKDNSILTYNVNAEPNFESDEKLQTIVDKIVALAKRRGKSTDALSITLIDVKTKEFAEYQENKLRYPASVVKLFWMAAFYSQLEAGIWQNEKDFQLDLDGMIKKSDNQAASRILDKITNSTSGAKLSKEEYQDWLDKRLLVSNFFRNADYKNIFISQKTFPIPYLKEYGSEPKGRDLQIRGNDPKNPIRNKISTQQAARLMYEIVTGKAISEQYSIKMRQKIRQNLKREVWEKIDINFEFNPILGFFGQFLPDNLDFLSKAGWTSHTRQEVAFIRTKDGKVAYILAIFSEDKAYARDFKIFPQISRLVFEAMKIRSKNDKTTFTLLPQSNIQKLPNKNLSNNPPSGL